MFSQPRFVSFPVEISDATTMPEIGICGVAPARISLLLPTAATFRRFIQKHPAPNHHDIAATAKFGIT
jgi:hypothetical protein